MAAVNESRIKTHCRLQEERRIQSLTPFTEHLHILIFLSVNVKCLNKLSPVALIMIAHVHVEIEY